MHPPLPPLPPPRLDDLRFSNTTGILQKKTMWFIGVEVEQETSAPPPKKNPGSAPATVLYIYRHIEKCICTCMRRSTYSRISITRTRIT